MDNDDDLFREGYAASLEAMLVEDGLLHPTGMPLAWCKGVIAAWEDSRGLESVLTDRARELGL